MRQGLLILLLALAVGVVVGCGDDTELAKGECTDADPTFVVEAVEPDIVDCDSEQAKSKVSDEVDKKEDCKTEAAIEQDDKAFCLEPVRGTFRQELEDAQKKGEDARKKSQEDLKKETEKLREELEKLGEDAR